MRVDAAVAAGDEVDRVGRLGRHRAEAVRRRLLADAELVVGARRQAGQLGAEDLEVGQRVRLGGRSAAPARRRPRAARSRPSVSAVSPRGADPLHGHGRGRVALPGEEQRARLEGGVVGQLRRGRSGGVRPEERGGGQSGERGPEERTARTSQSMREVLAEQRMGQRYCAPFGRRGQRKLTIRRAPGGRSPGRVPYRSFSCRRSCGSRGVRDQQGIRG